ncbi:MAG: DNA primase [Dysgonamonadaceae bacterium]|nr:DNA primase [Dysgonamonadaceae bacterium]MDD3901140.1 DNA primase [Dysgonamonadaceae bacterium]MDD4399650.1 DNA primase [Dysgonamonadaceae bacterium]
MIDQITISKIQDSAQIVDVVSDFVTLRRRGVNFVGLCPFHDDHSPSFYVSPSKNICKCFVCGEGGTPVNFIMKHEQLSYYEALKYVAKKYNIEVVEKELTNEEKEAQSVRESLFILNEFGRDYFVKTLHDHPEGLSVGMSYFRERGFRDDIVKKFQLGYSLEQRDAFSVEAQKNGYRREFLLKTGLSTGGDNGSPLYDRFRGRVIFPVHTLSGKVVAFGGRILKKAENTGKYVNSPESEIYSKSNELYGIYFAKNSIVKQDKCFLVEGYTDVLSMHQAGIENVVSSSGTALTHGQIRMIHRFSENITVLYDGDAAGIKAALRGIDLLLEDAMNVKVVLLPAGEDPDSFARKQNAESFHKYIEQNETDFIRFKTQLLLDESVGDPIKRAGVISNIVQSISLIPDNITRAVYIQDCARLLEMNEAVLIQEVNKIRRQKYDNNVKSESKSTLSYPQVEIKKESKSGEVSKSATDIKLSSKSPFLRFEKELIRYVVRYGTLPIYQKYRKVKKKVARQIVEEEVLEEEGPSVIQYIHYDLERDDIHFTNSVFAQIMDEALSRLSDADFVPGKYFLYHSDEIISKLASDLISDKYQLSKYHAKAIGEISDKDIEGVSQFDQNKSRLLEQNNLLMLVPRATTELKNAHVMNKIKEIRDALNTASSEDMLKLVAQLKDLQQMKKELAKVLGERIILKY